MIQAITGWCLWMYYSPSAQTAWESVYFVQYEVLGGWLLRGLHYWTAQVLVALLLLYVVQMIVRRSLPGAAGVRLLERAAAGRCSAWGSA